MKRELTCIVCPNSCEIEVVWEKDGENIRIESITGNTCRRGAEYAGRELTCPMRTIASSVAVEGGELPLASVRLTAPVPKERIFDVMEEIRGLRVSAPAAAGTVLIPDVCGLGSDVILTKNVGKREEGTV